MATNQTNYDKYERLLQLYLEAHPSKKGPFTDIDVDDEEQKAYLYIFVYAPLAVYAYMTIYFILQKYSA